MIVRKRWLCAAASVAALVAATLPPLASADAAGGLPPRAVRQIAALTSEKDARTALEGKLDTSLLTALQQRQGVALPDGVRVKTAVPKDGTGRVVVDVRGTVD